MKFLNRAALVFWVLLGVPLTILGVATALTLVISIMGIVSMFIAVILPFGLTAMALSWLLNKGWRKRPQ